MATEYGQVPGMRKRGVATPQSSCMHAHSGTPSALSLALADAVATALAEESDEDGALGELFGISHVCMHVCTHVYALHATYLFEVCTQVTIAPTTPFTEAALPNHCTPFPILTATHIKRQRLVQIKAEREAQATGD